MLTSTLQIGDVMTAAIKKATQLSVDSEELYAKANALARMHTLTNTQLAQAKKHAKESAKQANQTQAVSVKNLHLHIQVVVIDISCLLPVALTQALTPLITR